MPISIPSAINFAMYYGLETVEARGGGDGTPKGFILSGVHVIAERRVWGRLRGEWQQITNFKNFHHLG